MLGRIVGAAVAVATGRLPEHYIQRALTPAYRLPVPAAPSGGGYLAETAYDIYESKTTTQLRLRPSSYTAGFAATPAGHAVLAAARSAVQLAAGLDAVAGAGRWGSELEAGLPAMLEALCRGPAPAHVVGDFMEFFQGKSQISWQDLDSGIEGIKGTVRVSAVALPPVFFTPAVRTPPPAAQATRRQESSQVAVEFTSGEAYRANLKKHTRMAGNPDGKYAAAATSAQTVAQTFAVICVLLLTGNHLRSAGREICRGSTLKIGSRSRVVRRLCTQTRWLNLEFTSESATLQTP